ncbi:MAG: metal ABC transporter substrate-binding protein [Christensenellaceae bacterium]|nr:metal ABC transporter substrate-binding protein [Christensenellaceae bacterium]
MKKIIGFFAMVMLAFATITGLTACGKKDNKDKISIVCLGYAQYDWTMQILGEHKDNFEVRYLLDNGIDLHSYSPSPADTVLIKTADLLIYVGGESEEWVDEVINGTNVNGLSLLECISNPREEEWIVGMQPEDEDGGDHDDDDENDGNDNDDDGEEHEGEYDEHIWLSLKNARVLVNEIATEICKLDSGNSAAYIANANAYKEQLHTLDEKYKAATDNKTVDTILFADRFPFLYMAKDYRINYYAAFIGCSAETEATIETIAFLTEKAADLPVILVLENSNVNIAETVKNGGSQQILTMDSLQSVSKADMDSGKHYLAIMESNLGTLKIALGVAD